MAYGGSIKGQDGSLLANALKHEFMIKRSQNKNPLSRVNYKSRWFILFSDALRYYDGKLEVSASQQISNKRFCFGSSSFVNSRIS